MLTPYKNMDYIKMHIVLVFNPCLLHRYDLRILVQICLDVQLES
jgi:hypothetical protein